MSEPVVYPGPLEALKGWVREQLRMVSDALRDSWNAQRITLRDHERRLARLEERAAELDRLDELRERGIAPAHTAPDEFEPSGSGTRNERPRR